MQAVFGVAREKYNKLFYKEYQNDKGVFHFHSQIEIYFVDEGEMEVVVGERRQVLSAGQMSVALSYDPHGYSTPKSSRSSVLSIPTHLCKEFNDIIKNKKNTSPFLLDVERVAELREYARLLGSEDVNPIRKSGYIGLVLGFLLDYLVFEETEQKTDTDLASKMLLFINDKFRSALSLKDLATRFGYSESYISRFFRDSFKVGFNQYINLLRLKNALQLMMEKKYSITYCAMESGFNSMRSFYRIFSEQLGCSPKQWEAAEQQ